MGEEGPASHGGAHAVAASRRHGVETMFTLSGGHVFPLYDGAVKADPPMRIVDVRHEQTAVFAAEATARLCRTPGLAVLTAGPGVTNGVSAITTAHFNGLPTTDGARAACRNSTTQRCSRRSPSGLGPSMRPRGSAWRWTRRSGSPRPGTAARYSST
jgi:hypothetical protein